MDTSGFLNQILQASMNAATNNTQNNNNNNSALGSIVGGLLGGGNQNNSSTLGNVVGSLLGGGNQQNNGGSALGSIVGGLLGGGNQNNSSTLGNVVGGLLSSNSGKALAAGLAGALLGGKQSSGGLGGATKMGGLAALGMMAYQAYNNYQGTQAQSNNQVQKLNYQTVDKLSTQQVEQKSQAVLLALLGAAKADGVIDDREKQLIEGELSKMSNDQETLKWVQQQLARDLPAHEVASFAKTPEMAAEMFLISVLVIADANQDEEIYLQNLGKSLNLDPSLQQALKNQIRQSA